jgi:hypothetical protein
LTDRSACPACASAAGANCSTARRRDAKI